MIKEFRDFIVKGNLLQTAVAFIMGGAFGKVTEGFTAIVTNLLGKIGGQPDFSSFTPWNIPIGVFINTIINLLIVGFVLFLVIKAYTKVTAPKETAPAAPPEPTPTEKLLTEIRDSLRKQHGA
ncbi:MAG: large conductance mechanosensitive channel protein MscL [Verrucomicrobiales bacterium]|nr:large conductance mechanosensitive channel protein MscL [Verrucomicrobiales bacterium]